MEVFGIKIREISRKQILEKIEERLLASRFFRIATVNPEFLVLANKDEEFRNNLLSADMCIADGFGIVVVQFLRGKKIERFPGADLVEAVFRIAEEKGYSLFLATNKMGLSSYEEVREALVKKYPNIKVNGLDLDPKIENPPFVISENIVLCNYGAPEQEFFVENLRKTSPTVRLAIGVGGSFDYVTGRIQRAPLLMQQCGLEWLWRFILQPRRWKRMWNAVFVFPWHFFTCRFLKKKA